MSKSILLIALLPILLFAAAWDGTADSLWYTNNKTATAYTINTAEELAGLAAVVNRGTTFEGKTITLGANIVLNDTTGWRSWNDATTGLKQWVPIGNNRNICFSGNFDGNGKVISGLYINAEPYYVGYKGLFGCANSASISNLGLVGSYVRAQSNVGSVVGSVSSYGGTVRNSYVIGKVEASDAAAGIINGGTVENSYFAGNVICGAPCYYEEGLGSITNPNYGTVSNSFYDSDLASNLPNQNKGTPKTPAEMRDKNTYQGWDFGNIWGIGYPKGNPLNDGMPYLQLQTPMGATSVEQIPDMTYTGTQFKPTPTVKLNGAELKAGVDFDYVYGANIDVGKGSVAIVGKTTSLWGEKEFIFAIKKIQIPKPELVQNSFTYDGTTKTIRTNLNPGDYHFILGGDIQRTDASLPNYSAAATLEDTDHYEWQDGTTNTLYLDWTINRANGTCSVTMEDFATGETPSNPIPESSTNGTSSVSYSYKNLNDNSPETANKPANAGSYIVTAVFSPTSLNSNYDYNYLECIATAEFNIYAPTSLQVSWTIDSVFTYNKMVQAPMPSVEVPGIELIRLNTHSAAGIYKGADAAVAKIKDEALARNYNLVNNTKNYEIIKKDLKPYFNAPAGLSNLESNTDTLWVPSEIFADSTLLRQILNNLLSYDGFAQDTVTKEKDDISVLKNKVPAISLIYTPSQTMQKMLAKRVETTQTAVAVINTENVTADNYVLARRGITIMEIMDDEEETERVFCFRGNYCTELSGDICAFINGEQVATCSNIRKSCRIDENICINNMLLSECSSIGGTALTVSCQEASPASHSPLATSQMRVWQTASGSVNLDLGYMPSGSVILQIYNLKGKLVASEQVNTRFASVKINATNGIYLFRIGNRNLVKFIK